jgi:microcystin-dependent protein
MAILTVGAPRIQLFVPGTVTYASGYLLYTLAAGTTTPVATYTNTVDASNRTNPNTNPIVLDGNGMADLVINAATKIVFTTPTGNISSPIWTVDNLGTSSNDVVDGNGNFLETFTQATGAVNYINLANAATGNSPIVTGTGGDTNVGLNFNVKGSGAINLNANTNISGNLAVTGTSSFTGAASFTVPPSGALPSGFGMDYYGTSVPSGWLECNGQVISRSVYSGIFTAIGTTFGAGDGSTTFALPDFSRRVAVGRGGSGTATLANTVGATGGEETHVLTTPEIPAHTHTYTSATFASQYGTGAVSAANSTSAGTVGGSTGGGGAHNNIQPSVVVMKLIKI